ncbi:hypothetical protein B7494_g2342 [Chlorociboria aeruginascens]|nr:hypothetical protein B7494_g2342 [Chlorociboria aeruginascens]
MELYLPSIPSSSNTSDSEPLVCSDPDWTYPLGTGCKSCDFHFHIQQLENPTRDLEGVQRWVDDLAEQAQTADLAGQEFVGGARDQDVKGETPGEQDSQIQKSRNRCSDDTTTLDTGSGEPLSPPDLTNVDKWLSGIFSATLEDQMQDTIFVGGAEEATKLPSRSSMFSTENSSYKQSPECPTCFGPIGDPRDQHIVKCEYAHIEQERMQYARRRWLERLRGEEEPVDG